MRKLIRWLILILLLPGILAMMEQVAVFAYVRAAVFFTSWFLYGFLAYLIAHAVLLKQRIFFLETFEHELSHALVALLFFRSVRGFFVHPGGGAVVGHLGSNLFITLAPYFLPVFTLPLLIIKPFVVPGIYAKIDFLIGVTLAFHYVGLLKEFRAAQPDIQDGGLLFSLIVVIFLNCVVLLVILNFVTNTWSEIPGYFRDALAQAKIWYVQLYSECVPPAGERP